MWWVRVVSTHGCVTETSSLPWKNGTSAFTGLFFLLPRGYSMTCCLYHKPIGLQTYWFVIKTTCHGIPSRPKKEQPGECGSTVLPRQGRRFRHATMGRDDADPPHLHHWLRACKTRNPEKVR